MQLRNSIRTKDCLKCHLVDTLVTGENDTRDAFHFPMTGMLKSSSLLSSAGYLCDSLPKVPSNLLLISFLSNRLAG